MFRHLEMFHDAGEEARREAHRAFIPAPSEALKGLGKVNTDLLGFVGSRSPQREATLDPVSSTGQAMDATLVETHKQEALYSYKKYRAYQPLTTPYGATEPCMSRRCSEFWRWR